MASNLNRWDPWYRDATVPLPYSGDEVGYRAAAEWLDGLAVQDWGCGYGWFKRLHRGPYLGVDGSVTPWCDVHVDLAEHRSVTPGLMMRGVLEHDHRWQAILDNAVASFTQRMCLILFTPIVPTTRVLVTDVAGLGVPDISFALDDVTARLVGCDFSVVTVPTLTAYGAETILSISKP